MRISRVSSFSLARTKYLLKHQHIKIKRNGFHGAFYSSNVNNQDISALALKKVISRQFPHWKDLPLEQIEPGGWDNRSFRLGERLLVRIPSAKRYEPQVPKEHQFLPLFARHLRLEIPSPIALGLPTGELPYFWSIYSWIEGKSADLCNLTEPMEIELARSIAEFLKQLHRIPVERGPGPGEHNFYRGAHPLVYEHEFKELRHQISDKRMLESANEIWNSALQSKWHLSPVWVHGDLVASNLILADGKLKAVIDFGCMAIGDPACDLMISWLFFDDKSRAAFKAAVEVDSSTWDRARAWTLWKALKSRNTDLVNQIVEILFE